MCIRDRHFQFEKSIHLNVTNETLKDRKILVKWAVRNASAQILREEQEEISVPALESCWLPKVELPELDVFTQYVSYEAWENGNRISAGTVIFSYPKYHAFSLVVDIISERTVEIGSKVKVLIGEA